MEFNNAEIQDLMVYAFRYALGRKTYVTIAMSDILMKYKDKLSQDSKDLICRDIQYAIDVNNYGMPMDKDIWEIVKSELKNIDE